MTANETSALMKGEILAVTPKKIPVEDIISNIDADFRGLPLADAKEIRQDPARIVKSAPPVKRNLSSGEITALRDLRPADKGSATVV